MIPSMLGQHGDSHKRHDRYENYMDDDTVIVGCHYCRWESSGHEDEDAADRAFEQHVEDAEIEDGGW